MTTGLLVLMTPLRTIASQMSSLLQLANKHVKKTLYVHVQPIKMGNGCGAAHQCGYTPAEKYACSKLVSTIYTSAYRACYDLDVRILLDSLKQTECHKRETKTKFDVILTNCSRKSEVKIVLKENFVQNSDGIPIIYLPNDGIYPEEVARQDVNLFKNNWKEYDFIVLGGTFDRLHIGHKILLSEAILRCRKQLTVGITDERMIKKKVLYELILPTNKRIEAVRDFMEDVDRDLKYVIVPISNPFGPAIVDPALECIIVSEETLKGGRLVNEQRHIRGLSQLDMHVINLIEDMQHDAVEELKISSSSHRMRMLGKRLKEPQRKPGLPKWPYVIGLTGSIASGKSSIAKRFEKLGVATIYSDQLAHSTYLPGTDVHSKVIAEFGQGIADVNGIINRKKLGEKVFANPNLLTKLNKIVWPAVEIKIKNEISYYHQIGKQIILVEIPVLIESGMSRFVHEVWVSIIPKQEAIERIQRREGLSLEQAQNRVESQISNETRVAAANVVFSTMWDTEFTQKQVERAWHDLNKYLDEQYDPFVKIPQC